MRYFLSLMVVVFTLPAVAQERVQTYKVTLTTNWSQEAHLGLPGNAHFSPVVAVAHDCSYRLLPIGGLASAGLEDVAELGNPTGLNQEVEAQIQKNTVGDFLNTENMFVLQQDSQTFEIQVSKDHPLLSLVSMIAPSPDWVVGIDSIPLYTEVHGFFQGESKQIALYALNGGTEDGDVGGNFSLNNPETAPQAPIAKLTGTGFEKPFAFLKIESL